MIEMGCLKRLWVCISNIKEKNIYLEHIINAMNSKTDSDTLDKKCEEEQLDLLRNFILHLEPIEVQKLISFLHQYVDYERPAHLKDDRSYALAMVGALIPLGKLNELEDLYKTQFNEKFDAYKTRPKRDYSSMKCRGDVDWSNPDCLRF